MLRVVFVRIAGLRILMLKHWPAIIVIIASWVVIPSVRILRVRFVRLIIICIVMSFGVDCVVMVTCLCLVKVAKIVHGLLKDAVSNVINRLR